MRSLSYLEGAAREPAYRHHWNEWFKQRDPHLHLAWLEELANSPWGKRCWRVVGCYEQQQLVATALLYELALFVHGRRLRVCGLGGLAVDPAHRSRGLGTDFVERLHRQLADEGFDAMLLFSEIGTAYYERLGYTALPLQELRGSLSGWQARHAARTRQPTRAPALLRAYEARDLPALMELYNSALAQQELALLRDEDYWQARLLRMRRQDELFDRPRHPAALVVAEREGRVLAYLRTALVEGGSLLRVLEYGAELDAFEELADLQAFVLGQLGAAAPRWLAGVLPSRFARVSLASAQTWQVHLGERMLFRSLGAARLPAELHEDQHLVWATDWF